MKSISQFLIGVGFSFSILSCPAHELEIGAGVFVISLPDLGGEKRLEKLGLSVYSLLQYEGE